MLYFYTIYIKKIIDKSMCACLVLNVEGFYFFNQRSFRASRITDLMYAHDRQKLRVMYSGIQCLVHGDVPNICSHATYPQTLASRERVQIQRISPNLEQPSCSSSLLSCTLCSNIKFGTEKVRDRKQERVKTRRKSPKSLHPTPRLSPRPAVAFPGSGYMAAGKH